MSIVLAFLLAGLSLLAQVADDMGVVLYLQPVFEFLYQCILYGGPPIVLLFVAWAAKKWLNVTISEQHRQALLGALSNAAALGIDKARGATNNITPTIRNKALGEAINYATASVPDALAYFNISPNRLAEMAEAQIAKILADKNTLPVAVEEPAPPAQ